MLIELIYNNISQSIFPDAQIVPFGTFTNIHALKSVVNELNNSIFGIEFFLIRDRDGLSDTTISSLESNVRFKCLRRPHIENYLLDTEILSEVAKDLHLDVDKQDLKQIEKALFDIASESIISGIHWKIEEYIKFNGAITQPKRSKDNASQISLDDFSKQVLEQLEIEVKELQEKFKPSEINNLIIAEHSKLQDSLRNGEWKKILPGKFIFTRFCGFFNKKSEIIRERYVDIAISTKPEVFQDIIEIFNTFKQIEKSS